MSVPLLLSSPRRLVALALCLGLLCFASLAQAATRNVPSHYPTIQAAISAAHTGDTVLIADGTYTGPGNVDVDFGGKNITVTSVNGPTNTIIDCGGSSRGFILDSGETSAVLSGLTIKNGYEGGQGGGGINIVNNSTGTISVTNCIISGNTAVFSGGIYAENDSTGTISVTNCTISGNMANYNDGGLGIYNYINGTINVTNCTVSGNTADQSSGGGIDNQNYGTGTISITDCTVNGNTANQGGGGGLNNSNNSTGTLSVTNCTVSNNNSSSLAGGGIDNQNSGSGTLTVLGCTISGNTASNYGGGLYNTNGDTGTLSVIGCTISGNTANNGGGGGLYNENSGSGAFSVTGCTVSGNTANVGGGFYNLIQGGGTFSVINSTVSGNTANSGGGFYTYNISSSAGDSTLSVINCTIRNNSASTNGGGLYNFNTTDGSGGAGVLAVTNTIAYGDTGGEVFNDPGTTLPVVVTYSDIQGGYAGTGNINANPQFASSANLHLLFGSPCLGAGNHSVAPATAQDGRTRPNPPSIGAYEILPPSITSLSPTSAYAGGGSLALTVNGSGFLSGAVVKFGSTSLATTFVSGTQLTATITSTLRATVGAYTIKVYNPGSVASSGATFTVKPRLTGLTLSASRVSSGQTVTGTVTLNGPAPTGGVVIPLTSSDTTRATVPANLTVAAGATSATFPITTLAVTTTGSTTITANGAGGTLTATLTVLAPVTPTADTFGQDGSTAGTNYGTTNPLLVKTATSPGTNRDSYLQFSLSGLSSITSAKLQVTAYLSGSGSLTTGVYGTSSAWTESGLTWNNKPALGSSLGSFTATTTTNVVYTVDVTAYVQSQLASGTVSFGLHNPSASTLVTRILSREASSGAAQLVIVGN